MLVAKEVLNRIDEIVERAYLDFTFLILGEDFLSPEQKVKVEALGLIIGRRPLIELLYILARQRSTPGYRRDQTLNELLNEISQTGFLPILNDANRYSIEHAKALINEAIEDTKRDLKKRVKQQILKVNNDYKNDIAVQRVGSVPRTQEKRESGLKALVAGVLGLGALIKPNFVRAFTTALTGLVNNATVDAATTELPLLAQLKKPEQVQVFKTVVDDNALCAWCAKFYRNRDGSPVMFTLAELQANGSNGGKPKSAWEPALGPTHPRCRCQLHYVR